MGKRFVSYRALCKLVAVRVHVRVWASHVGSESEIHHPGMSLENFRGNWQTSSVGVSGL